jgi:uncharacterized flavoprotein (TIGR03862 family)
MAAETAALAGARVTVFEAMPSVGCKLLVAGSSGLNLTHNEPFERFLAHYGDVPPAFERALRDFGPTQLRDWALQLGVETFVGSSGRVFPVGKSAAPLLSLWKQRLAALNVEFRLQHRFSGWSPAGGLSFVTPEGPRHFGADATLLALGGASWPQTGSTGAWAAVLNDRGLEVSAFRPANCGFTVAWSEVFRAKYSGHPLKSVAVVDGDVRKPGEMLVTEEGLQGSLVYAFAARWRDRLAQGPYTLRLDLCPDLSESGVARRLGKPRGSKSWSVHLERTLGIKGVKAGLLREATWPHLPTDNDRLAALIKSCPLVLQATSSLERAISSAGGIAWSELGGWQLNKVPGVFVAGEMLDWEAPTGGYLLTACWATGRAAAIDSLRFLGFPL